MIHSAYVKSEIARRYFILKGESLTRQQANNRWKMVRNPDKKIVQKVVDEISREQKAKIKAS